MSFWGVTVLASLLLLLTLDTPKMQTCDAVVAGRAAAVAIYPSHERGLVQALRFSRGEPWCGAWTIVTVYRRVRGPGPAWEVSRSTGDGNTRSAAITTSWTTSGVCPAIFSALENVEGIPVRLGLPYPIRAKSKPVKAYPAMLDTIGYSLETTSFADPAAEIVYVDLRAGHGGVARWVDATLKSLQPCLG